MIHESINRSTKLKVQTAERSQQEKYLPLWIFYIWQPKFCALYFLYINDELLNNQQILSTEYSKWLIEMSKLNAYCYYFNFQSSCLSLKHQWILCYDFTTVTSQAPWKEWFNRQTLHIYLLITPPYRYADIWYHQIQLYKSSYKLILNIQSEEINAMKCKVLAASLLL
jgi:hypothetical protein